MKTLRRGDSGGLPASFAKSFWMVVALGGVIVVWRLVSPNALWSANWRLTSQTESAPNFEVIHYPSGNDSIEAYLAEPKGAGKHPAVIVVHDDQGLTESTKNVANLLAQAGFVTLEPNLLSRYGSVPTDGYKTVPPVNALHTDETVQDVEAAFNFLQRRDGVDAGRISAIGIGWGGWRTYKLAEDQPTLHRLVVFYGVTPDDNEVSNIKTPVLAHYAQADFLITASSLKTKQWLGDKLRYYIYPGTEHGFFAGGSGVGLDLAALSGEQDLEAVAREKARQMKTFGGDSGSAAATSDAAKLAWDRTLVFLTD